MAAPETASTGFSDEASRSDDVETTLCISTSMTFSVSSRYDSAIGYTKLDISTMDAPDLFDDVAEPKVPQVRLSTDTDYFRKLAPEDTYSSDGDNIERNPEPVSF